MKVHHAFQATHKTGSRRMRWRMGIGGILLGLSVSLMVHAQPAPSPVRDASGDALAAGDVRNPSVLNVTPAITTPQISSVTSSVPDNATATDPSRSTVPRITPAPEPRG